MTWLTRLFRGESPEPGVPSVHSVTFDTRGWSPGKTKGNALKWSNPDGDTLSSRIDAQATENRLPLMDLEALRALYRDETADLGGGIVSVDVVRAGQLPVIKVISKYERRPAYAYDGRLIVPLKNASCTLTMHSIERGVTGTRDAVVGAQLAQRGELEIEAADEPGAPRRVKGWFQDPYDPGWPGRSLYSMSDDERLDALFPQHPLSKVRNALTMIQGTLSVDRSVLPDRIDSPSSLEGVPLEGARRLLSSGAVGSLYLMAGRFDLAETVLAESVSSADEGGANDIRVARELLLLGLAQEFQDKYLDAERSLSRSCAMFRATVGEEDPDAAQAMTNLGRMYVCLDRHEEAEPLFGRALKVFQERALPSSAAVALNGLGMVRNAEGRHAEALAFLERALAIFEEVRGPQFPDCADVLRNMAAAFQGLGEGGKASAALERARQVQAGSGSRSQT
jgi:tetratricopeptide (TPR) repeat protein